VVAWLSEPGEGARETKLRRIVLLSSLGNSLSKDFRTPAREVTLARLGDPTYLLSHVGIQEPG